MKLLILLTSILKQDFRDRKKIFFSIVFPIVFMIIFGFTAYGNSGSVITIGYSGDMNTIFINTIKKFKYNVKYLPDLSAIENDVNKGKIDFGILYKNKVFEQVLNKADIQNYNLYLNTFDSLIKNYTLKLSKSKIFFKTDNINVTPKNVSGLAFLIPGIIALSIMSASMFSAIEIISRYKKDNILKRFAVTPLKPINFLFSGFVSKIILTFISAYIVFLTALLIFNVNFQINFLALSLTIITSSILMFLFGTAIAVIFKSPETASNVGSMLFTIMAFFSGIYFPIRFLPKNLQIIGNFLPATYVSQFMRYSLGIENLSLQYVLIFNIIVASISVILLPILSKGLFLLKEE